MNRDDTTPSRPLVNASPSLVSKGEPERVFTLGELIEVRALERLCRTFSKLCKAELAICTAAGTRLDHPSEVGTCAPCAQANRFAIPVKWKGHTLGCVVVLEDDPDEHAREFADLVADVLAGMCRAQAHIRKRVSELSAVYDLGGLFAGDEDLGTILNITAQRICEVMNVKASNIRVLDSASQTLVIAGEHNLSERYLRKGPVTLSENPIDAAAFAGEIVYIEDAGTDPRVRFPEHARHEGIVSGLCCPMSYRGHTVGVLRIYTATKQTFGNFDRELLRAVASQAAAAIVHTRLYRESIAAADNERQLCLGGDVQRRMLPDQPPHHEHITFGQVYEPSLNVGGDFFDFLDLPDGNLGVAIADVVGKGLPGALMMASVRAALRAHAQSIFDIDDITGRVNRHLCRDTLVSEFATLFYGVFSPNGRRFTYCNAGHNPPLLLRGNIFSELETGGLVIGVVPDEIYEKGVLELSSGDLLIFYTDGVTEALDYQEDLYGIDRFKESILRYRDEPAHTLANQLLWDVRRYAGLARQADDITLVVAKVS